VAGGGIVENKDESEITKWVGVKGTKWVRVKDFMRDVLRYNNLNTFLFLLDHHPVEDLPLSHRAEGREPSHIYATGHWTTDDFFPLSLVSNEIFVKVPTIGNKIDLNSEEIHEVRMEMGPGHEGLCFHQTPRWTYWNRLECWTPLEAAFLLFEEEPDQDALKSCTSFCYPVKSIAALQEVIERGFHAGNIHGFEKADMIQLHTHSLIEWVKKQGFMVPEEVETPIGIEADSITPTGDFAETHSKVLSGKEKRELGILRQKCNK